MNKSFKKILTVGLCAAMMFSLAGCGNDDAEENKDQQTADAFPFTLTTYQDTEVTFTKVPERILSTNTNTGEQLMAMGLGDKIIGTCNNKVATVKEEYREAYEALPSIADKDPSLEMVLDLAPDFIYGRSEVFKDKRIASHETLNSYGIPSLSSIEGYKIGCTIEDVYQDFYNLGRIFQKQDRANEIVDEMKGIVSDVQDKVKGEDPVRVFVYDSSKSGGAFTPGNNLTTDLIRLAGGVNVFGDLEKTWNTVSWESVVEANPEVIVVLDYGNAPLDQKYKELKENQAIKDIDAIKNNRIFDVQLPEVYAGACSAETVEKFAKQFHPEAYK